MTNDITTLNGALTELGETIADNLQSMGVTTASPNDGLTTLAGKILDIEPSVAGLALDTSLIVDCSFPEISYGGSVSVDGVLLVSYDDETLDDVDLEGYLQNATIVFKEGNTTLATSVTDGTGETSATITGLSIGTHTIKAVFEGTANFDGCESDTVTVEVVGSIPSQLFLSASKDILSYVDSEQSVLTATVLDENNNPVPNATVLFDDGSGIFDIQTTGANGTCTYTYESAGAGDVTISAEVDGTLVSESYTVHDYWLYAPTIPSYTLTNLITGYSKIVFDNLISLPPTFEIDFTAKTIGSSSLMATLIVGEDVNNYYYQGIDRDGLINCISRNNSRTLINRNQIRKSTNTEYNLKITYDGTADLKLYNGSNEVISTNNSEYNKSKLIGGIVGTSWEIKNIIVKQL